MKSKCPKSGKVQFLTQVTADMWIRSQNDKNSKRKGFKPLSRAYQCKHCGLWHTTTKEEIRMTAKIDYRARILRILVAYPQGVTANGLIKALPFKCSERTVYNSLREFKRRGLTTLDRYECCDNCQSKIRKHKLTDRGLKEVR